MCSGCPPSSSVEDIVTREPIPTVDCSAPSLSIITSTKTGGDAEPTHPGMPSHPGQPSQPGMPTHPGAPSQPWMPSEPGVPTGTGGVPVPTGAPTPSEVPVAAAGKMVGSVGAVAVAIAAYVL